jgi:ABC-type polysaccharide/polyol phosphate transport system ATPase subunit
MFQGMAREEISAKMDDIIRFAEIEEFIDEPVSSYSSGMKARLGFAVAFQIQPDVLLLDEVIGVGDADFQRKSMEVMKERIRSHDTTIVFVSHSAPLVRELCNRAVWIEDRIVQIEGDVETVLAAYETFLRTGRRKLAEPSVARPTVRVSARAARSVTRRRRRGSLSFAASPRSSSGRCSDCARAVPA